MDGFTLAACVPDSLLEWIFYFFVGALIGAEGLYWIEQNVVLIALGGIGVALLAGVVVARNRKNQRGETESR